MITNDVDGSTTRFLWLYNQIFKELIKVVFYSMILFFLIFFDSIILYYFIPLDSQDSLTGLFILIILIESCQHFLSSNALKRALSSYSVKFKKLYDELKIITIFITFISITFIILMFMPLIIHELNSINYRQPLLNTIGWFSLIEGITLGILLPIFSHKKRKILQV